MSARNYVGMYRDEAIRKALLEDGATKVRVAFEDGKVLATKTNTDPERLNFRVEDGIITDQAYG